ncbi:uncharacterized protein PV07_05198 [Cladophialophora immunda]|uniref:Uncharacterized protein n=1 Tax=Cladophialophora immunda TaxID=569365 RepID=A0A0D2CGP8_9EURO|nr:uncharacterized protein PV07_05198 [Cladophialophora immunda]KIW29380.1 hypothetical protein PV07_05198 [Cladophialophora immunda]
MDQSDGSSNPNFPMGKPYDVGVGHALITMIEPKSGHEVEYNRWYEDDHMFAGALNLPWCFSARRWVATYDLQNMRLPKPYAMAAESAPQACYLSTYWIAPGKLDEHKECSYSVYNRLLAERRIFFERIHVFTSFQDKVGTIYRDASVPNDIFTLMDPAPGLVLEVLSTTSENRRGDLLNWLLSLHLPSRVKEHGPVSSAMVFCSPGNDRMMTQEVKNQLGDVASTANDPCKMTILWFLDKDPREIWNGIFSAEPELVRQSGQGQLSFMIPFIPAKLGTNKYVDQLRRPS